MSLVGARFLMLLDPGVESGPIRSCLPSTASVVVAGLGDSVGRMARLLEEATPDLVLVGCSGPSEMALNVIREVTGRQGACPVVVLYQGNPNGFMDPAFEAGADDLVALPFLSQQLVFSLEKVLVRRRGPAHAAAAPLIVVLGPKGGTGKTLTACNLAVALAQRDVRPIVVDIDLQFGDVGLALGMKPTRTIYDLAISGGTLDSEKIDDYLVPHKSGARVLLAPIRPDQAAAVNITFLRKVFEIMRSRYDFVIVDTPPAFTPEVIAAVDSATHLCVVGMLDALSLKDTKIGLETLAQMGYDAEGIQLVLNRADTSVGIGQDDVLQLLGKAPDVLVPSDRAIPRAITDGRAIVEAEPRSGAARAFAALAEHYLEQARTARVAATTRSSAAGEPAEPAERRRAKLRRG